MVVAPGGMTATWLNAGSRRAPLGESVRFRSCRPRYSPSLTIMQSRRSPPRWWCRGGRPASPPLLRKIWSNNPAERLSCGKGRCGISSVSRLSRGDLVLDRRLGFRGGRRQSPAPARSPADPGSRQPGSGPRHRDPSAAHRRTRARPPEAASPSRRGSRTGPCRVRSRRTRGHAWPRRAATRGPNDERGRDIIRDAKWSQPVRFQAHAGGGAVTMVAGRGQMRRMASAL